MGRPRDFAGEAFAGLELLSILVPAGSLLLLLSPLALLLSPLPGTTPFSAPSSMALDSRRSLATRSRMALGVAPAGAEKGISWLVMGGGKGV